MIPNEAFNNLILIFFAIFYIGFIFYQQRQKIFPFSYDIFSKKPLKRLPFFDYAKGIAILAVFIIHTSYLLDFFNGRLPLYFLDLSQIINRFARFAIPIFLISSGALLTLPNLDKKNLKIFYADKLKRLLIPYIVFSLPAIYLILKMPWNISIQFLIVPFWFIPLLLQLYFLYPALWYVLTTKKIRPVLFLFFALLFSIGCYFFPTFLPDLQLSNLFLGPYLFFFVLGMILRPMLFSGNKEWLEKIHFPFWSILAVIFYFSIGLIDAKAQYFNYQFIYGPVIFLLLFYSFKWFSKFSFARFIQKVGENSLYFYLIHFYILFSLVSLIGFFNLFYINPFFLFAVLTIFGFLTNYFLIFFIAQFFIRHIHRFSNNQIKNGF